MIVQGFLFGISFGLKSEWCWHCGVRVADATLGPLLLRGASDLLLADCRTCFRLNSEKETWWNMAWVSHWYRTPSPWVIKLHGVLWQTGRLIFANDQLVRSLQQVNMAPKKPAKKGRAQTCKCRNRHSKPELDSTYSTWFQTIPNYSKGFDLVRDAFCFAFKHTSEGPSSRRWRQRAWQSQPFSRMQAWTANSVFNLFQFPYLWSRFRHGIWSSWQIYGGLSNFETHVVGPTFSDEGLKKTRCAQETRSRSCKEAKCSKGSCFRVGAFQYISADMMDCCASLTSYGFI